MFSSNESEDMGARDNRSISAEEKLLRGLCRGEFGDSPLVRLWSFLVTIFASAFLKLTCTVNTPEEHSVLTSKL